MKCCAYLKIIKYPNAVNKVLLKYTFTKLKQNNKHSQIKDITGILFIILSLITTPINK